MADFEREGPYDSMTDDELGQIRRLARLTGIGHEELEKVWRKHRKEKARVEVDADFMVMGGRGDPSGAPNSAGRTESARAAHDELAQSAPQSWSVEAPATRKPQDDRNGAGAERKRRWE